MLPDKTIAKRITDNLNILGGKTFLVKYDSSGQTYSEIADISSRISCLIPENSIAAILIDNPSFIIPAILACWSRNTIAAIFEPQIKYDKFKSIKELTGISFLITDSELGNEFSKENIKNIKNLPENKTGQTLSINISDDCVAMLLFTSGSTGIPKCVPLSLFNIWSNIKNFTDIMKINGNDVFLSSSPLFYAHALYNSFLTALFLGATVIYCGVLNLMNAANTIKLANAYNASIYHLTPSMMQILLMISSRLKAPFPKFKHIICGTAKLEIDLKDKFEKALNCIITQQYGMTETLFISVNAEKQQTNPESVGIPIACEIRISDDHKQLLPKGTNGNISLKSLSSFGSYFKQSKETNESYIDGWFFTGDIGIIDNDGYLTITGRKKEIIKKGGFNINPNEINMILSKYPGVLEASTVSIPDLAYGEEIYSFVAGSSLVENNLIDYCRKNLSASHIPKRIFILPQLPKTANGKINMPELKIKAENSILL